MRLIIRTEISAHLPAVGALPSTATSAVFVLVLLYVLVVVLFLVVVVGSARAQFDERLRLEPKICTESFENGRGCMKNSC